MKLEILTDLLSSEDFLAIMDPVERIQMQEELNSLKLKETPHAVEQNLSSVSSPQVCFTTGDPEQTSMKNRTHPNFEYESTLLKTLAPMDFFDRFVSELKTILIK